MWIIYALLCALFASFADVASKLISKKIDPLFVVFWGLVVASMVVLPIAFLTQEKLPTNIEFILIMLVDAPLYGLLLVFYTKALKIGEMSLVLPILKLSPILILLASPIFSDDIPSVIGCIGIVIVVIGTYVLNIKHSKKGLLVPIKVLLNSPGVKEMFFVIVIACFIVNIEKVALRYENQIWYLAILFPLTSLSLIPSMILRKSEMKIPKNVKEISLLSLGGLFLAAHTGMYAYSISLAPAAYVISIKRLSVLFGTIWGYLIFKEKDVKERFVGSLISLIGVVIIVIFG